MKLVFYVLLLSFSLPCASTWGQVVVKAQASKAQESLAMASSRGPATYRPVIGEVHADFKLPNIQTGEAISLSEFRGKKVLLVHFASW